METNIALGPFVNCTQLLFRVMGAPPCHNNSLKEEQFNVNNIFSICLLMKTFQSTGKMFLLFQKEKHNRKKDELITSMADCSQRRSISPLEWELLVAYIHLFTFAFFKEVSCLPLFRNFNAIFTRNSSERCASWLICMDTFAGKWRYFTCQAPVLSSEKFDRSVIIWLGEIHPICAFNETAWQGHTGNYFARYIVLQSNKIRLYISLEPIVCHSLIF